MLAKIFTRLVGSRLGDDDDELKEMRRWLEEMWLVKIDDDRLTSVAGELAGRDFVVPDWRIKDVLPEDDRIFINWLPYLCAVDFCFVSPTGPPFRWHIDDFYGSMAMGHCFYRHFGERVIVAGEFLELLDNPEGVSKFFASEIGPPPLLEKRIEFLKEVAMAMRDLNNNPIGLFTGADFNAPALVMMLRARFPTVYGSDFLPDLCRRKSNGSNSHSDSGNGSNNGLINGNGRCDLPVGMSGFVFDKRARLLVLMYQGRALHSDGKMTLLKSMDRLKALADTALPRALQELGIIAYHPQLQRRISNWSALCSNGLEEVSIRLATMYVVEKLLKEINHYRRKNHRSEISVVELDYFLWQMGRESKKFKSHRCLTTNY